MVSRRLPSRVGIVAVVILALTSFDRNHAGVSAAANLVVAYAFDEGAGTTASDASGNGNTGTLVGGASWAAGHTGQAANFDGVNDLVSAGNVPALNGLTRVTVSAWVKGSVGPSSAGAILVGKDAAFALVVGAHKARFAVKSGSTWYGPSSLTSVDDGQFHFLAGVYDGTAVRVYVDGVLEATQNIGSRTLNTVATDLLIASCLGGPNCDASGEMWRGVVDDVRIYNRALTLAEVQADKDSPVAPPPPDVSAPSVPTNVTGTPVSATRIDLSWTASTDDVGVTGYNVYRDGSLIATTANPSYSNTALTASTTYFYRVAAFDAAGNTSAPSAAINVTTQAAGDTTPPSTPTNLAGTAVSSSQIDVTWSASTDNIGVTGYKVFRDGAQIATTTSPNYSNSGLAAGTSYSYAVSAVDLAGNESAKSQAVSVTTTTPPGPQPTVAFSFDEGQGLTANDASGNHNNGALINGPSWVAGHSGAALNFDGANDYVNAGNIGALNGLRAVTVSAWVKGAVGSGSPDAILVAKDAAFALLVDAHKAQFAVKSANKWYGFPSSTANVDDGQFHFLAGVYDGAVVRIYVDGVQQATQTIGALTLNSPTAGLLIASCVNGPNCHPSGEMWAGVVDDVRVYGVALTTAQIQADYATPVSPPDSTPPSTPANVAGVGVSISQINLTWNASTDAVGVTGYRVFRNGVQVGTPTGTSFSDTGLTVLTQYTYTVVAVDAAGNASSPSTPVNVTTQGDTTAPSTPTNVAGTPVSSSRINLTWTASTDNVGVTGYKVFRNGQQIATTATPSYADTGLALSTPYAYSVAAFDAVGNTSAASTPITVTTLGDTTPPSVPTNLGGTAVSSTQINLSWTASTDDVGVTGYKVFRNGSQIATTATPSYSDSGLTLGTSYAYAVAAVDAAGNTSASTAAINVTTQGDTSAPTVPTDLAGTAASSTQINLTWTASTDNVAVTGYKVFRNGSQIATTATPSYSDTGLTLSTTYAYAVAAFDASGNTSASTASINVTTLGDTAAPSVPANLAGTATSTTQINLTWTASTDNVAVTGYQVFRNGSQIATTATASYSDTGLTLATTYAYAVAAYDAAGNTSASTAAINVTTQGDTAAPTVPTNLAGTAASSTQINLTWAASTDNVAVTGYAVFRGGSQIATVSAPAYSDSGLAASTSYSYEVAAFDAAGNSSARSAPVNVTTQPSSTGSTVLARDDFNRANGPIGPNWKVIDSDPVVVNGHVQETNASDGNDSIPIYTAVTWPADHYSQVRVLAATQHSGCAAIVRAKDDPVIEMYFVYVTGPLGNNTRLTLAKFVTHVYTELWTDTLRVNSGDVLYLSVSGSTLTVKLNGTVLATRSDTSITAPGFAGLDVTDYDGRGAPGDGQCDDWEAGAISTVTAPANVGGTAVSSSEIDLSWDASTADAGVAGYRVFRDGSQIATTVNTFYNDTGLALGTSYSYAIRAVDTDGNVSAPSTPITVTTLGDTTPPSAPTNLAGSAVSSSQISLTWTPSTDNVGIASYKIFRGSTQVGTSTGPSYSDTGLTASTSYTYAVSALDPAGNESALSLPTTVATDNTPPVGLPVVAFAFDEGSGASTSDLSGNGNNGSFLNGAGWTAGHAGSAAQFDGVNDYVSAGNITALNGLTAVTVSAWVRGSVGATSPDAVIVVKDAAFALVVDGHKALFGVKSGNTWLGLAPSTTSVDDNQYHFLSGVYDGTTVRVYVDGVLEVSQNIGSHTLNSPTTGLQIASCVGGPNCFSSGEMWQGAVDDVRVYNRALTASEIVNDMQNPVKQSP